MTEEQRKAVRDIAAHYGLKSQEQMAIEECAELIQAITKHNRIKIGEQGYIASITGIAEEIADVMIMCEQLTVLYGIRGVVEEQLEFKIARQQERMRKGE